MGGQQYPAQEQTVETHGSTDTDQRSGQQIAPASLLLGDTQRQVEDGQTQASEEPVDGVEVGLLYGDGGHRCQEQSQAGHRRIPVAHPEGSLDPAGRGRWRPTPAPPAPGTWARCRTRSVAGIGGLLASGLPGPGFPRRGETRRTRAPPRQLPALPGQNRSGPASTRSGAGRRPGAGTGRPLRGREEAGARAYLFPLAALRVVVMPACSEESRAMARARW